MKFLKKKFKNFSKNFQTLPNSMLIDKSANFIVGISVIEVILSQGCVPSTHLDLGQYFSIQNFQERRKIMTL